MKKFLKGQILCFNMRREVSISVFAVLIVAAAILTVYYLNVGLTGFAVFEQNTQTAFDEGIYSNVLYDTNSSSVVLAVNQTSGTYTSKVFDSGSASSTWNNLTSQGNGVTFEVRSCSTSDCANTSFSAPSDINNLNLTGQYLQYRASFNSANDSLSSVVVDYSVPVAEPAVTVSLSEPIGEKDSLTEIPLTFTTTGNNLNCSYEVEHAVTGTIVKNDTIANCASTTFDLPDEADYILTILVTGIAGSASDEVGFSVSVPEDEETSEEETEVPVEEEIVPVPVANVVQLTLADVPGQDMIQGDSIALTISAQNTGNVPLTSCTLTSDNGLASVTSGAQNIAAGASVAFSFSVTVPEETVAGAQTLGLSVTCAETSGSKQVTINVAQKKLDFNITNVQRTRDDRVRVDYVLTELSGENQEVEIFFSIKDASGVEVGNVSQNRSVDANGTDDFRTNIQINETLLPVNETTGEAIETNLTLSAAFNSQVYSSSVLEPISLGAPIGGFAIFGGEGGTGSIVVLLVVVVVLGAVFVVVRKLRKAKSA